jgi:hypothetical protein
MLITTNKSCVADYLSVFVKKSADGISIYDEIDDSGELTVATLV